MTKMIKLKIPNYLIMPPEFSWEEFIYFVNSDKNNNIFKIIGIINKNLNVISSKIKAKQTYIYINNVTIHNKLFNLIHYKSWNLGRCYLPNTGKDFLFPLNKNILWTLNRKIINPTINNRFKTWAEYNRNEIKLITKFMPEEKQRIYKKLFDRYNEKAVLKVPQKIITEFKINKLI